MVGKYVQQLGGYRAFIPERFPTKDQLALSPQVVSLLSKADLLVGKLDGITQLVPDIDFFIFMYVRKEAALSTQIEGTRATMIDSIRADAKLEMNLPDDVGDILQYIKAMNLGLRRLEALPLSLRLIKEIHKTLLLGGRQTHFSDPGNFRKTQNWIGGNSPETARYVPPPPEDLMRSLGDIENFFYENSSVPILAKAALIHSQFEAVHPFLDGNGRVGRLLITFYLCQQGVLERPVLYLSEYFKAHRESYFELLHSYHQKGGVDRWVSFFLQGVIEVSKDAINTSKEINNLCRKDAKRIQFLGRSAPKGTKILEELYRLPVVNVNTIQKWLRTTRATANAYANKFVELGVLVQQDVSVEYGRTFEYKEYLDIFRSR
ncbi:MAG: Fic/DOC family N-terminal domain-containing protein [Patescibacteria group bacterium]